MQIRPARIAFLVLLAVTSAASLVNAAVIGGGGTTGNLLPPTSHVTDGAFTKPDEWSGSNVVKTGFTVGGVANAAYLSAANGYNPAVVPTTFDVFFQVPKDGNDYVAQIQSTPDGLGGFSSSLSLFEKPSGTVAPEVDGSFVLTADPWTQDSTSDPDFVAGSFQSAIGFGTSPDSLTNHLMAEFQLAINTSLFPVPVPPTNGLYDPSRAAWTASVTSGIAADPPISSGIFQLNPDGSTTVTPLFGPDHGPVLQPQDAVAVPEPASAIVFLGLGAIGLVGFVRRRAGRTAAY